MKVEQYVMAYGVEQDRIRAILPDGFTSLRPVLRINAEIRDDREGYVEFNVPVERDGNRGWLNISHWDDVPFFREGKKVVFKTEFLEISFTGVGIEGSCPAGNDAHGVSSGKTLPAYPTDVKNVYPKEAFTAENAAKIPCKQVLGTYGGVFEI